MPDKPLGQLVITDSQPKLIVTQVDVDVLIKKVVRKMVDNRFKPKLLICIATGGIFSGPIIARVLGIPYAVWMAQHYDDDETKGTGSMRKKLSFATQLVFISPGGKECELTPELVASDLRLIDLHDDLDDSGGTFHEGERQLRDKFGQSFALKTSCLWHKTSSNYYVDFVGEVIKPESTTNKWPWIMQPHEQLVETLSHDLAAELESYREI